MDNQIGSIVRFTGNQWGVYCGSNTDDKYSDLWGVSLLTASYYARLYSMVKKDQSARHNLITCIQNPLLVHSVLADAMDEYTDFYKTGDAAFSYDLSLTTETPDRESSFMISYDLEGHFSPKFRQKGFGILGKNIEAGTVSACLATSVFFIDTHKRDKDYEDIVYKTISTLGSKILHKNKLSIIHEGKAVRETVMSVMQYSELLI